MHKRMKFIATLMVAATMTVGLTACGNINKVSSDAFTKAADGLSLKTADVTDETLDAMGNQIEMDNVTIAYPKDDSYTIYFYDFKNDSDAKTSFNNVKNQVDSDKKEAVSESGTSSASGNHSKLSQTCDSVYYRCTRVDDTLAYAITDKDHKDDVNQLFDAIGY